MSIIILTPSTSLAGFIMGESRRLGSAVSLSEDLEKIKLQKMKIRLS